MAWVWRETSKTTLNHFLNSQVHYLNENERVARNVNYLRKVIIRDDIAPRAFPIEQIFDTFSESVNFIMQQSGLHPHYSCSYDSVTAVQHSFEEDDQTGIRTS
ncbi:hypothetical protein [Enterobacter mori]|uniref:hypothetical protein n=1 Tax=Enterobacter mori TaxID=539813 RepID=UPI002944D4F3|nr:hypothetical protein [Citrobacter freundii]